jgi:hypothetical protein
MILQGWRELNAAGARICLAEATMYCTKCGVELWDNVCFSHFFC